MCMSRKMLFDRKAFFAVEVPKLAVFIILSFAVDLILIWNLTLGMPDNVASEEDRLLIWNWVFGFLLALNFVILKTGLIYAFFNKLAKWKTGYVEICANEIIHCEEKREIPLNRVKFELGYVLGEPKKMFDYFLVYRIQQVDKLKIANSGSLTIDGKIEMNIIDETLGLEMGIDEHFNTQITNHSIPAYYQGMEIIKLKLEEMVLRQKMKDSKNSFKSNFHF